jgi:N-acetylglutamate synthase/N-acetylornithine aminotransferase
MINFAPSNGAPAELHLPRGFLFSAGLAGIKESGKPDLAYAEAPGGAAAAAMFTTNRERPCTSRSRQFRQRKLCDRTWWPFRV